jgi:hypothetical protein
MPEEIEPDKKLDLLKLEYEKAAQRYQFVYQAPTETTR